MISHSEVQTSYKVRVASFNQKMKTWEPGRVICSKYFNVEGVKLRIVLYPNGRTQGDVNHISFFICNESEVAIDLLCNIKRGSKSKIDDENFHIPAESGFGWSKSYKHKDDKDSKDKNFETTVTIKKLWKQVQEDGDNNNEADNSQSVKKMLGSLEKRIERFEASVGGAVSIQKMTYPECPICLQDMIQVTRSMQCQTGQLICGDCHDMLVRKTCPYCQKEIMGRCHGMEAYQRNAFA